MVRLIRRLGAVDMVIERVFDGGKQNGGGDPVWILISVFILPLVGVEDQLTACPVEIHNSLFGFRCQSYLIDQTDRQFLIIELSADQFRAVGGQGLVHDVHFHRLGSVLFFRYCYRNMGQIRITVRDVGIGVDPLIHIGSHIAVNELLIGGVIHARIAKNRITFDLHSFSDMVKGIHRAVFMKNKTVSGIGHTGFVDILEYLLQLTFRQVTKVRAVGVFIIISIGVWLEYRLIDMRDTVPLIRPIGAHLYGCAGIAAQKHVLQLIGGVRFFLITGQTCNNACLWVQHSALVVITGLTGGNQRTVCAFVDAHTNGEEHGFLIVLDTHCPLVIVGGQHRVVAVNALTVGAGICATASVVGPLQHIIVNIGGVGRLTVRNQNEHRLTPHCVGAFVLIFTHCGGVGGIILDGLEDLIAHRNTGLRVGTDALNSAGTGIGIGSSLGVFQGAAAKQVIDGKGIIGGRMVEGLFLRDQVFVIVCSIAIQRKQLPRTA